MKLEGLVSGARPGVATIPVPMSVFADSTTLITLLHRQHPILQSVSTMHARAHTLRDGDQEIPNPLKTVLNPGSFKWEQVGINVAFNAHTTMDSRHRHTCWKRLMQVEVTMKLHADDPGRGNANSCLSPHSACTIAQD